MAAASNHQSAFPATGSMAPYILLETATPGQWVSDRLFTGSLMLDECLIGAQGLCRFRSSVYRARPRRRGNRIKNTLLQMLATVIGTKRHCASWLISWPE